MNTVGAGQQQLWELRTHFSYLIDETEDSEEDAELGTLGVGSSNPFWKKILIISPTHFEEDDTQTYYIIFLLPAQSILEEQHGFQHFPWH